MKRTYASDAEREQVISQSMALGFSREDAEYRADYPDADLVQIDETTGRPRLVRGPTFAELKRAHNLKEPPHGEE